MDQKIFFIVVQIAVLLFAISVHESAHAWMAMRCGDNTAHDLGRISLNPLRHIDPIGSILVPAMLAFAGAPIFGWAKPTPVSLRNVRNPRRANLLVSAAGPVSNLLLAAGFSLLVFPLRGVLASVSDPQSVWIPLFYIVAASVMVNVFLAVFNLIPVPPLDGFGIVESLAPPSAIPALIFLRRWGFVLFLLVVFSGILNPLFQLVSVPLNAFLFSR
jgi:Zn-dependent protease